jgi:hypothetical protein
MPGVLTTTTRSILFCRIGSRRHAPDAGAASGPDRRPHERTSPPAAAALAPACCRLVTLLCSASSLKIQVQAAREGETTLRFIAGVFSGVSWTRWLLLMVPYSAFFLVIDSLVIWRVINWFNTRVRYLEILPIRASAYIISILDERIGKGAIGYYLHRLDGVPGWQVDRRCSS